MRKFVLGGLLVSIMAVSAQAQTFSKSVAAGKRTLVGAFALYSSDTCYAGPLPDAKISEQPAYGRFEIGAERVVDKAGNCAAMQIYYRTVYYIPHPGFRGQDRGSVTFIFNQFSDAPGYTNRTHSYNISVR